MKRDRATQLHGLLARHAPADDRERRHVERMLELLGSTGDPFSRDHYEPGHFTASAFVLSPDSTRLLLVLHGKLHRWLQPGGHVDPGDATLLLAALREVREETAVEDVDPVGDGLLDVDVHMIPAIGTAPPHDHFDVRFLLRARSESFRAGSDAKSARWVDLRAIAELESDASVMRAVAKIAR